MTFIPGKSWKLSIKFGESLFLNSKFPDPSNISKTEMFTLFRFAEALKSPTTGDSPSCQVELRTRPKSEFVERPENPSFRTRPLSHLEQSVRDKVGLKTVENRVSPVADQGWEQSELQLHMYIVGGREVGQVTVFRRPLSIWRLDLTKL